MFTKKSSPQNFSMAIFGGPRWFSTTDGGDGRLWWSAAVSGSASNNQWCKVVVNGENIRKKKLQQLRLHKKNNCSNEGCPEVDEIYF